MFSEMPRNAGTQRADAAHDQVDLHARHRRVIQRLDDLRLDQRVHLGDDARRLALRAMAISRSVFSSSASCSVNGDCRIFCIVATRVGLVSCRNSSCRSSPIGFVAGEQAVVGVEARRVRVIVAGAAVAVAS